MTSTPAQRLTRELARTRPGLVIDTSALTLSQYSYDASNYRVPPAAVAFPRDADDVGAVLRAAAQAGLAVTARGSGTSMAGNAVGAGVVLDCSRHLTGIRSIDPQARIATVEAGVLLDTLQARSAAHGLMFGPDPSSHSRITFGGMVGNDACGNHSVAHGRTSDHVVSVEAVLADGTPVVADRGGLRALHPADSAQVARVEGGLRALAARHLAILRTQLDRLPRQVSGYHLHRLLPEHGFDVAKALAGSEGTLAVITAVTVKLVARPRTTAMVVVGYDDLVDAARDVPDIVALGPTAVEALDEAIVAATRRRGGSTTPELPDGRAWLYIELSAGEAGPDAGDGPARTADNADLRNRIDLLVAALQLGGHVRELRVVTDPAEREVLWRVREDGAGLAANLPGAARSWPGWEDAAVAPAKLAEYLVGFRALLAGHGYTGVLYGHFGAGCVHVRIDFDTATEIGRRRMRTFVHDAAELVSSLGGTVSGEHGDGRARSELLPIMYSPQAVQSFAELKQLLDPKGLLNPGIIVDAAPLTEDMLPARSDAAPMSRTTLAFGSDAGSLSGAAGRCVGVGRCVAPVGGVMCPSYRATGLEKDSTRGRARSLQDYLTGTAAVGGPDVLQTLDLCLSCKACATDCPTGVDMASYKSEFLSQYYKGRLRPRSHYSLGWLPTLARLAAPIAPVVNAVTSKRTVRAALPALAGVTSRREVPRFATRRTRTAALASVPGRGGDAVLFIDTFTRAFRPDIAGAAVRVLADAGVTVSLAPTGCCGLTWITTGQLTHATRVLRRTVSRLSAPEVAGKPVIVLEPSCAAALAGDAAELVPTEQAQELSARVMTFEHALRTLARDSWSMPQLPRAGVLQTHCHERSVLATSAQASTLRSAGMSDLDEAIGCCGLAGNFGFEADHYDTSMAVAETALAPALRRAPTDAVFVADGFGCRAQIDHLQPGRRSRHLAEVIDQALGASISDSTDRPMNTEPCREALS